MSMGLYDAGIFDSWIRNIANVPAQGARWSADWFEVFIRGLVLDPWPLLSDQSALRGPCNRRDPFFVFSC